MRRFDDLYKPRSHSLRFMRVSFLDSDSNLTRIIYTFSSHQIPAKNSSASQSKTSRTTTTMKFPTTLLFLPTLFLSLAHAAPSATTAKFYLRSSTTYTPWNSIPFGSVGSVNGTLVAGLQPQQTLPIGGSITSGVLSFVGADPSDDAQPAYLIHGATGSWVALDVWAAPQKGYSLDKGGYLLVGGAGAFYGMFGFWLVSLNGGKCRGME